MKVKMKNTKNIIVSVTICILFIALIVELTLGIIQKRVDSLLMNVVNSLPHLSGAYPFFYGFLTAVFIALLIALAYLNYVCIFKTKRTD